MSIGNEFQADGAETAKSLSVNRRRVRGVMKSPLDLERSRHVHVYLLLNVLIMDLFLEQSSVAGL